MWAPSLLCSYVMPPLLCNSAPLLISLRRSHIDHTPLPPSSASILHLSSHLSPSLAMRCSVACELQRLEQLSFAQLCRATYSQRVRGPRQPRCSRHRAAASFHSIVDTSRADSNRAHKQTLSALSKARPNQAGDATHPSAAQYETVIGLEVHCQLITNTKLFSRSSSAFGSSPNSQTSAIDAALPGTLPHAVNAHCVVQCIRTALALGTRPQPLTRFDRKHYFYADMPQGYQITQQSHPVIRGGRVGAVRVERVQLEQDSGKCLHDLHASYTHVDLNRAGMPLIEMVTQPDMRSGEEAVAFVRQLSGLLRHAGICRAQMEDGSMRCDVNVSVRRRGGTAFGERVEIKNLNSLRSLHRAVQYEADRQIAACESGAAVARETRTFDSRRGVSVLLRTKEQLLDYRFMADPDLPWLRITPEQVREVERTMGESEEQQRHRLVGQYGLSEYDAQVLVSEQGAVSYFERLVHGEEQADTVGEAPSGGSDVSARPQLRSPKLAVSWLTSELFGRLRRQQGEQQTSWTDDGDVEEEEEAEAEEEHSGGQLGVHGQETAEAEERRIRGGGRREQLLSACAVPSAQLASLLDLLQAGRISGKTAKLVLDAMVDSSSGGGGVGDAGGQSESAADVVARLGLSTVERDEGALEEWVSAVFEREAEGVERYVSKANSRFVGFLVGEVLKASSGKADPKLVAARVRTVLQQHVDAAQ